MSKHTVSLVTYDQPLESLRRAVDLCGGLERIKPGAKVFLKPNIVFWTASVPFPKWGVITTSRVMQDMVHLLKERGVDDISIVEGMVLGRPGQTEVTEHAFESLGYNELKKRYGIKVLDAFQRSYKEMDLGEGMKLSYNADVLEGDLVISLPVMKTHAQTTVSMALKNLKGLIDVNSRKRCHNADPEKNLHYWVSRLAEPLPPVMAVIDGIFTSEYGPGFEGLAHRSDLLVASWDLLSADKVGASLLGHAPEKVPHMVHALKRAGRPLDLSDVEIKGEPLEEHAKLHEWSFPYNEDSSLPLGLEKKGIKGLGYYKYDNTLCTYCSGANGVVLAAIIGAFNGEPFDDVEVLTGKAMQPRPGAKKTILLGKCMYQAHKDNPDIAEMIPVKGCPPKPEQIIKALHQAGIMADPALFEHVDRMPGFYMKRYKDKPEFDQSLFTVD
ncbi:MAG: DUF362 domain-containing protein [Desulfarculaceae bacterium]|nr:DUF362 domain-containing protein [Desulfarculaceae bacterium]MCF8071689.1 DUF362 domain-containing protein [Desulfarculaceae bacterium]MCF8102464.1 DUF362 domain-containing protein [Desulfarculaceae bacterium]MCF8116806.1 DUF362 domain-containing protein [Desulfarculaceae bacterium]